MRNKWMAVAAGIALICATPNVWADERDKKTTFTINQTIMIPGATLAPGTYVMLLDNSSSNRHIVRVFNEDQSHLQATILAFANAKTQPSDKTELTYWETPAGLPPALRGWFWPGDVDGQEFAYPKDVADRLSAANNNAVVPIDDRTEVSQNKSEPAPVNSEVTGRSSTTESTATTVAESTPRNTADTAAAVPAAQSAVQSDVNNRRSEELLAQNNAPPARSPDPVAEARPATPTTVAQVNAPPSNSISELPQTASATPWVLAIGVSALLIAVAIRYRRITI